MKKLILTSLAICAIAISSFAAVTVHFYNKDGKAVTMKVKIDGSMKEVTFSNSTADVTIQGGATECILYTSCGEVTIKAGDKLEIKDGCVKKY